jgi:hypothetical protein
MAKKKSQPKVEEIPIMILTNEIGNQAKANMILMVYKAVQMGQLGFMDGLNPDTGDIEPLLVGIEPKADDPRQFNVYPLARIFSKLEGIPQYLMPDGQGNYLDYRPKSSNAGAVGISAGEELTDISGLPAEKEDRPSSEG